MTNPKRDESRDYGIWHEKHVLIPWAAVPEGSTVFERYVPISALEEAADRATAVNGEPFTLTALHGL